VHGGITFARSEPCEHEDGQGHWFGFDCAHWNDANHDPVFNPNWGDKAQSLWKIYQDFPILSHQHFWTEDEVALETNRLAEQLAAAT